MVIVLCNSSVPLFWEGKFSLAKFFALLPQGQNHHMGQMRALYCRWVFVILVCGKSLSCCPMQVKHAAANSEPTSARLLHIRLYGRKWRAPRLLLHVRHIASSCRVESKKTDQTANRPMITSAWEFFILTDIKFLLLFESFIEPCEGKTTVTSNIVRSSCRSWSALYRR